MTVDAALAEEIHRAGAELVTGFAYLVDHRRYDEAAGLFTTSGTLSRGDRTTTGREAIREALQRRSVENDTRHICGSPHFLRLAADEATAVTYAMFVRVHAGSTSWDGRAQAVVDYHDTFALTADGWRIAARRIAPFAAVSAP